MDAAEGGGSSVMNDNAKTCALYIRVSTEGQSLHNQRPAVLHLAKARGFEIVEVYEEKVSAAKDRPVFERMMLDAHRGRWSVLVVWALDRFGRSMTGNLTAVLELDRIGVQVVSVREPWLDTSSPVRSLLVAIFSWVAEQERRRISERTIAGIDRARRSGKVIGRPRVAIDLPKALTLRATGMSIRQVAATLRVGAATLHRVLQAHEALAVGTLAAVPKPATNEHLASAGNDMTARAA